MKGVRQHPNGDWYIDYRLPSGSRRRETIGSNKKLAEQVMCKRRAEIAEGKYLDKVKEERIRFEVFADEYLRLHSMVNNKSWRKSDLCNVNVLKRSFAGRFLKDITPRLIEEFKANKAQEVSPARVNRLLSCLRAMFNRAKAWKRFTGENPVQSVKLFKENNERTRFLEQEEIIRLLANCSQGIRPIVEVALNTGMRLGEILGLKWRDIDFQRGIIYLYKTKNGEKRELPMNEVVKKALAGLPRYEMSEFVFCYKDGTPRRDIRGSFLTALTKSGIKDFHFHDLRHTFASHLVMGGVDLNTLRELLGHKDLKMTLRYSHLSANHKRLAVEVLDKRMDTFWTDDVLSQMGVQQEECVTA